MSTGKPNDPSSRRGATPATNAARRAAESEEGPGLWWQLWEFFGLTWPARDRPRDTSRPPLCAACHNPTRRPSAEAPWRCPNHPSAGHLPPDDQA